MSDREIDAMLSDRLDSRQPVEGHLSLAGVNLFYRDLGAGHPIVVLHGGPDLDHNYLLPEMDRLSDSFRLIYYDQRGRGRSGDGVMPEDVGIESEIDDIESVRRHFGVDYLALLGHSWGGLLALEYAIRHPDRVSHLILMNTAPASHTGMLELRRHFAEIRPREVIEAMAALSATDRYRNGDLEAESDYCRLHFGIALPRPEHLELLIPRVRANFDEEGVRKARAIEDRLHEQTWSSADYDLLPALGGLGIPTLVLHGDKDFIPVKIATDMAEAIGARLEIIPECGHFAYLEYPDLVHRHISAFLN